MIDHLQLLDLNGGHVIKIEKMLKRNKKAQEMTHCKDDHVQCDGSLIQLNKIRNRGF